VINQKFCYVITPPRGTWIKRSIIMFKFLNKLAPVIGKYFRPLVLIFLSLILWAVAFVLFTSIQSIWDILFKIFFGVLFFIAGIISLCMIAKPDVTVYDGWGAGAYIFTVIVIFLFGLKLLGTNLFDLVDTLLFYLFP